MQPLWNNIPCLNNIPFNWHLPLGGTDSADHEEEFDDRTTRRRHPALPDPWRTHRSSEIAAGCQALQQRGHNALLAPLHIAPENLTDFIGGATLAPNLDGLIITPRPRDHTLDRRGAGQGLPYGAGRRHVCRRARIDGRLLLENDTAVI